MPSRLGLGSACQGNAMNSNIPLIPPPEAVADAATARLRASPLPLSPLARATAGAAFASLLPRLQAALHDLRDPDCDLMETLASNISELQESFADTLYGELCRFEVNLSIKITLRLDKEAQLVLLGEHPDGDSISRLLTGSPELSAAFAEIAAQSAALRDLRSLSAKVLYPDASGALAAMYSVIA